MKSNHATGTRRKPEVPGEGAKKGLSFMNPIHVGSLLAGALEARVSARSSLNSYGTKTKNHGRVAGVG